MKNTTVLVALVIGLSVGIPVGVFVGGRSTIESEGDGNVLVPVTDNSCKKYKDMYDSLRIDFIQLQDKAADSASSHCPQPQEVTVNLPVKPVEVLDTEPAQAEPEEKNSAETEIRKQEQTPATTSDSEAEALLASYKSVEKEMSTADTPKKKRKFLDRVRLSTPMQTIDGMKGVTPNDRFYEKLFGTFKGTLQFSNKARKDGRVTLIIRMPPDQVDPPDPRIWTVRIDVDDGAGKISRQHGGMDMLRTLGDQSNAFFMRSSETSYLQMFYRQSSDQFLGNFYEKNGAGDYPQRAIFWLKRKDQ